MLTSSMTYEENDAKKIRTKNHKSTTTHKRQKLSFHSPAAASSLQLPPSSSLMFSSPSWAATSPSARWVLSFSLQPEVSAYLSNSFAFITGILLLPGCLNQETIILSSATFHVASWVPLVHISSILCLSSASFSFALCSFSNCFCSLH